MRRARMLTAGLVVAVAVGLGVGGGGAAVQAAPTAPTPTTAPTASSDDDLMRTVIADVQDFWAAAFPAVYGKAFTPVPGSRLIAYSEASPPPGCGEAGTTPYDEVEDNAFYCNVDDFLAWDTDGLIAELRAAYGDFVVALVAAHELGHVVQERAGISATSTLPLELQADCFTGAWVAHATTTTADTYNLTTADLGQALSGYLYFRDPQGTNPRAEGAHGSAFDRIAAFSDGFSGGAQRCRDYDRVPPTVTELPYTSSSDEANAGNLAFADILDVARRDLNAYWKKASGTTPVVELVDSAARVRECGAKGQPVAGCAAGVVAYDRAALRAVYQKYGDFAVATLLAEGWAEAAARLGTVRSARAPDRRVGECLAGAWTAALSEGAIAGGGTLSPGDLDEAVAVLLAYPGRSTRGNGAFTRFEAFHTGFDDGATACGLVMRSA